MATKDLKNHAWNSHCQIQKAFYMFLK